VKIYNNIVYIIIPHIAIVWNVISFFKRGFSFASENVHRLFHTKFDNMDTSIAMILDKR